ncbi:MAG: GNAT family N-acetyltransferase [Pyrinomonadaceae bacterium]
MINFVLAETPEQIEQARRLFQEYQMWLNLDLSFQGFESELATLPGRYAPPEGCLLLAIENENILGCVALRKIDSEICEMKRLFVRETARGNGIGRELVKELIEQARRIGYRKMRLDTLSGRMNTAQNIYSAFGFREIPAYYETPFAQTIFMEMPLSNQTA